MAKNKRWKIQQGEDMLHQNDLSILNKETFMKRRMFMVSSTGLFLCILLASCTSMPLRTMLKLRGFSSDDFAALDPNEVMLKILLPEPLEVDPEQTKIEVDFLFDDQSTKNYSFPLELINTETETTGWRRKKTWRYFTLQITPEGKQAFVKLQRNMEQNMENKSTGRLSASARFKKLQPEEIPEEAKISLLLQLNKQDGFFTLINKFKVDFEK